MFNRDFNPKKFTIGLGEVGEDWNWNIKTNIIFKTYIYLLNLINICGKVLKNLDFSFSVKDDLITLKVIV